MVRRSGMHTWCAVLAATLCLWCAHAAVRLSAKEFAITFNAGEFARTSTATSRLVMRSASEVQEYAPERVTCTLSGYAGSFKDAWTCVDDSMPAHLEFDPMLTEVTCDVMMMSTSFDEGACYLRYGIRRRRTSRSRRNVRSGLPAPFARKWNDTPSVPHVQDVHTTTDRDEDRFYDEGFATGQSDPHSGGLSGAAIAGVNEPLSGEGGPKWRSSHRLLRTTNIFSNK
ncbi:unnamed protein product (mitochondrion) [Plasmodiophora brassicae]|uniref:Uncharacterized protein n=1 Tax=Plasmodiophora brassicae TaxID=37360 RepID=A0A3P3Y921_PLABS|nr:unnamed protein product [Plasmodiophora brassicae]